MTLGLIDALEELCRLDELAPEELVPDECVIVEALLDTAGPDDVVPVLGAVVVVLGAPDVGGTLVEAWDEVAGSEGGYGG